MKRFKTTLNLKGMIKPLVFMFFFFALLINVNAQVISVNKINAPATVIGTGSLNPDVITGTAVTVTETGGSICNTVTYEWESASDGNFTANVIHNLAATKDYDPGTLTSTTYFRRVASVECNSPDCSAKSTCIAIKITIL